MKKLVLQPRTIILFSVVFVLIALGLGASIGYDISSSRTSLLTETQPTSIKTVVVPYTITQSPSTETVLRYSTFTTTLTTLANKTYPVLTITEEVVQFIVYLPTCVNGSVTYEHGAFGGSTSVTYIYPTTAPSSSIVSVTTVFIFGEINRTQSQSISC